MDRHHWISSASVLIRRKKPTPVATEVTL